MRGCGNTGCEGENEDRALGLLATQGRCSSARQDGTGFAVKIRSKVTLRLVQQALKAIIFENKCPFFQSNALLVQRLRPPKMLPSTPRKISRPSELPMVRAVDLAMV